MKNLNLVVDTNVFLVMIASANRYHWIYQSLVKGKFILSVSNDIVLEYEEKLGERYKTSFVNDLFELFYLLPNIQFVESFYQWNLIYFDPDDNKFIDCAISANADFIVTNDSDFDVLKKISFPKMEILSAEQFEIKFKPVFAM